jgi:LmbE family N-acetylglucosaminyl deacetylase
VALSVFLSPHFDDIALSCGGIAARLARAGSRCIAITIFTAPPPEGAPLSAFAQGMHDEWQRTGGSAKRVNETRRDEERAAMHLLNLEPVWLDLPDAPYRRGSDGRYLYTSNPELMGTVAPEERRSLVPRIAGEIGRVVTERGGEGRGRVRLFAPLGVGRHVDHQLAFRAARRLGPRYGVLYYEDYPYAARQGALEARITEIGKPIQPRLMPITDLIGLKIAAIARYKSQLSGLFTGSDEMPGEVRAYFGAVAGGIAGGQYAERVWQIKAARRAG